MGGLEPASRCDEPEGFAWWNGPVSGFCLRVKNWLTRSDGPGRNRPPATAGPAGRTGGLEIGDGFLLFDK